ncbi:MAG TPA: hypothetical protein VHC63_03640 [Acidimicrobiales bacterium]|nr:hypothetical protein [Acidimicrobiales bacterium]
MPYAFLQYVPANAEMYGQIRAKLGDRPEGLITHIAHVVDGGLRYTDVWDSEEAWEQWRWNTLEPAVGEVLASYGLPHSHDLVRLDPIDVVSTWFGTGSTANAYSFTLRVPSTPEMYAEIEGKLGDEPPQGLVAHIVRVVDGGLEYIDVWESHDLWLKFKNVTLVPTVTEVLAGHGITHTDEGVTYEPMEVLDVWA